MAPTRKSPKELFFVRSAMRTGHRSSRELPFPTSTDPRQQGHLACPRQSFSPPTPAAIPLAVDELAFSLGVGVPKRRVEVTDLLGVIKAVAAFGRDVQGANPAASFEVSTRVIAGRKPRGFDAADKADAFGGRAFLRSDVDESAFHRFLVNPAVSVDGARAPESTQ